MRQAGTVTGPLILIAVGVVFLLHTISPNFDVADILIRYWPYLLIVWGLVQLLEVCVRFTMNRALPVSGISPASWFLIILICILGFTAFEVRRPDTWWRRAGFERGVQAFGEEHEYAIHTFARSVGRTPRIVIDSFRGDAKITGSDSATLTLNGHKIVRAFNLNDADYANRQTPVDVVIEGNTITVRCNQDRANSQSPVSTNIDLTVPRGATIEAVGRSGDFDISSIGGEVNISSDNAGVRLEDVDGNVKIDTRRSDLVRCINMKGNVDLRGHGTDVELAKVTGQVTVNGNYTGSVALRELAQPVRLESMRTELNAQQVPGEIRLERGSLNVQNVVGPFRLTTRSTDVNVDGFTDGLDLTVDKGDIDLRPGRLPLGKMVVHTKSGNIDLALPYTAKFALSATTDHGEIENDFGEALTGRTEGRGAKLQGVVGEGPDLQLNTHRGSITVRKATASDAPTKISGPIAAPDATLKQVAFGVFGQRVARRR